MLQFQAALGLLVFFGAAFGLSEDRGAARIRIAIAGIAAQILLAALLLKVDVLRAAFALLGDGVAALQAASEAGTGMVFGYLGGGPLPFEETRAGASFVLAFRALPLILLLSALTALLNYWRVLPWLVHCMSLILGRVMGLGGAASLGVAANVFLGMVEAPLLVRPWIARMSRSELFVLMTAGMATVAGTVMVLYAAILGDSLDGAAGHLLTASLISAPAAIAIARLMIPETEPDQAGASVEPSTAHGAMDAITQGTESGVRLLINIAAALIVLVALVHLVNSGLGLLPNVAGSAITLERALGWAMQPVAWLMGIPWAEAAAAGSLLGVKTVLNELLAYLQLAALAPEALSETSRVVMTYALCGFANPGSLGILIGGLATIAPDRRDEIVALGFRSIVAGTLATCSTGCVVALLMG